MSKIGHVLACLAFVGHGLRLLIPSAEQQRNPRAASQRLPEWTRLDGPEVDQGRLHPLRLIAVMLLTFDPASAFQPAASGAHFRIGSSSVPPSYSVLLDLQTLNRCRTPVISMITTLRTSGKAALAGSPRSKPAGRRATSEDRELLDAIIRTLEPERMNEVINTLKASGDVKCAEVLEGEVLKASFQAPGRQGIVNGVARTAFNADDLPDGEKLRPSQAVKGLYAAFNARDVESVASFLTDDCVYEDLLLGPATVCRGKQAFMNALQFHPAFVGSWLFGKLPFADLLPDLMLVVDSVAEGEGTVGVEWHVEWGRFSLPLGRGLSQARICPRTGKIARVVDIAEAPWRVIGLIAAPFVNALQKISPEISQMPDINNRSRSVEDNGEESNAAAFREE